MKLFELQRARDEKSKEARALIQKAIDENRASTDAEKADVDSRKAEIVELSRKIELFELRDSFDPAGIGNSDGGRLGVELPDLDGKHPYSVLRALRMQLAVREGVPGARFDGLEAEVHQTLAKEKPPGSEVRGTLIPWNLATHRRGVEQRDVNTTAAAGGIANVLGTTFIDLLRNRMVMQNMGASVLTGLVGGTFALPKQLTGETAYHVAEGVAPTASNLTLGQVVWTPRTLGAQSAISRKTLIQTSLDIEAKVRMSILLQLAREFDRVGVNGSGSANVPLGIMQDPSVPTVAIGTNGGAPTWAMVCNLESQVAQSNADFGTLGYITSNKGRSKMKQTTKIASSQYSDFLWQKGEALGQGEVNSYRAMASEQVPSNLTKGSLSGTATALIYGNWESATYGLWSGVDTLIDPYTAGNTGAIKLYCFQDYDLQFLYEQSFAKCVDIDPS